MNAQLVNSKVNFGVVDSHVDFVTVELLSFTYVILFFFWVVTLQ